MKKLLIIGSILFLTLLVVFPSKSFATHNVSVSENFSTTICHHNPGNSVTLTFNNLQSYLGHLGTPHNGSTYDTAGACATASPTASATATATVSPTPAPSDEENPSASPTASINPTETPEETEAPTTSASASPTVQVTSTNTSDGRSDGHMDSLGCLRPEDNCNHVQQPTLVAGVELPSTGDNNLSLAIGLFVFLVGVLIAFNIKITNYEKKQFPELNERLK